jgi:hypothetical protein
MEELRSTGSGSCEPVEHQYKKEHEAGNGNFNLRASVAQFEVVRSPEESHNSSAELGLSLEPQARLGSVELEVQARGFGDSDGMK